MTDYIGAMRFSRLLATLSVSFFAAAASVGCASADDHDSDDTGEDSAELRVRGNSGFFVVTRRDFRRCMAPLCGGYYVKRVNATTSRCGDGSYAAECYVGSLDLDALGLSDQEEADFEALATSGKAILRGGFERLGGQFPNVSGLTVVEGWRGANGVVAPQGTSYRVTSSGIMCITSPCPSLQEGKLNSSKEQKIHALELGTTAAQEDLDAAFASLADKDGVLVTGTNKSYRGFAGQGTKLVATEFYVRVKPAPLPPPPPPPPVDQACGSRGMGPCPTGQFCQFEESAQCGALDHGGVCKDQPTICTKIYAPVCGCDGQTYGNECMAHSAGVSVASTGECAP